MSALELWRAARDTLATGEHAALTVVSDHTRHSPGTRGARVLQTRALTLGTVGGGIMERKALERGQAALDAPEAFSPVAQTLYHRKDAPGARSGLICAGWQTNVCMLLRPERDLGAVSDAVTRLEEDRPGLLTYTPGVGLAVRDASPDPGAPVTRTVATLNGWRFEEQLMALKRVAIFGAGHCGLALSRQMSWLGYTVTILDDRADLPTLAQNTWARHRATGAPFEGLAAAVSHPEITSAVVMTADMPSDVAALDGVLREAFPFVGVMGAPAKLRAIQERLKKRGFDDDAIARVRGPVGVPIGSSTPPEIAVSVAAQLVGLHPELFPGAQVLHADAQAPV